MPRDLIRRLSWNNGANLRKRLYIKEEMDRAYILRHKNLFVNNFLSMSYINQELSNK